MNNPAFYIIIGVILFAIAIWLIKYLLSYYESVKVIKNQIEFADDWKEEILLREELRAVLWSVIPGFTPEMVKNLFRRLHRAKMKAKRNKKSFKILKIVLLSVVIVCAVGIVVGVCFRISESKPVSVPPSDNSQNSESSYHELSSVSETSSETASSDVSLSSSDETSSAVETSSEITVSSQPQIIEYVVQSGDSMWVIAEEHGTTLDKLIAYNNLGGYDYIINPGEVLKIPPEDYEIPETESE